MCDFWTIFGEKQNYDIFCCNAHAYIVCYKLNHWQRFGLSYDNYGPFVVGHVHRYELIKQQQNRGGGSQSTLCPK